MLLASRSVPLQSQSRMMISTQLLGTCSPPIPRPGASMQSQGSSLAARRRPACSGFPKSRGSRGGSTWAIKQASSSPSSPDEDGTKTMEFVDLILPTKLVDGQLPPLLSLVIDGLPPFQISKYVDEAEKRLNEYVERYHNVNALASYYRAGLSAAAYGHLDAINVDRLVAISINYGLQFLLDDLFFDDPNEFLQDQYGISHNALGSSQEIQEYLDHLNAVFGQQVQPSNPNPLIETIMREAGQYTLEMSNPEWFNYFVAGVVEFHQASVASHADIVQSHNLYFQDVESYSIMRSGNVGGTFIQLMVELASDKYIPSLLRTNLYFENLTIATSIHLGFVNDVFSYHKENFLEQNPRNLISVLFKCEGKPFVQTVHMAINLTNTYARAILDLESQAWNSTLKNYIHDIKALIAGNVYFCFMDYRYRHPDSVFLELRDITSSWKILPHTKGQGS